MTLQEEIARRRRDVRAEVQHDLERYLAHSVEDETEYRGLTREQVLFELRKNAHKIEKGLAMASPRRPFGLRVKDSLEKLLVLAPAGPDRAHAERALAALEAWNASGAIDEELAPRCPHVSSPVPSGLDDFAAFVASRHTVRDFDTDRRPDAATVARAVDLAATTPSGCNRQPWIVRTFSQRSEIDAVLAHQDGNAGFGAGIPLLLLVSVDGSMFFASRERNARFVEGGLYAMTLTLALHAAGLATCLLNCSLATASADALRELVGAADSEDFIIMIGVGAPRTGARIARSPRMPRRTT